MKKYHYTYRITNILLKMYYYGTRSTNLNPKDDLGIKYFSSSSDKEFIQDQKENPQNYKYKIIHIYDNRKSAIEMEIKLHNKFNVGISEKFYNRAKQTSTGFDTTGMSFQFSEEHKRKMSSSSIGRKHTEETKDKISIINKGRKHTEETKDKISIANKGKIKSLETRSKLSISNKGKIRTEETKDKISIANKGKPAWNKGLKGEYGGWILSEEIRKKLSEDRIGRKQRILMCPHCYKAGGAANMKRYHFDNCKIIPSSLVS